MIVIHGTKKLHARLEDICSYTAGVWLADRPYTVKGQKDCIWPDRAMLALLNRAGEVAPSKIQCRATGGLCEVP